MANDRVIAPELLRKLLAYDAETGRLFWKERPKEFFKTEASANAWNAKHAGKPAICTRHPHGYATGAILGKAVQAHRVIWAMTTGKWPQADIDHINGVRDDNRLANLRAVSRSENGKNQKLHVTNTSGCVGVSWCRRQKAWSARITFNGKRKHIGYFAAQDIAIRARLRVAKELGFHENHGRR